MADTTPMYNLKVVTNEVGLSPATLRAWERRYGLLKPKRTPGGHRLYSRQDIEMLKWLVERQDEGLSISRAIEMWNRLHENQNHLYQQVLSEGETILDRLRRQWLDACLVFDEQAANLVLDQVFSIVNTEIACIEVLQKGIAQIGDGWYSGAISVQQEHFASAIASRRINALLSGVSVTNGRGVILAACPPGEEHDFALLMLCYLLRRRGWNVVYLGANVPLVNLDDTIQSTSPSLIISVAQTLNSAASLRLMAEYIGSREVPFAYGGGIFNLLPAATKSISGYYLGTELAGVPQAVENIIAAPGAIPVAQPVPPDYIQALNQFLQNEAFLKDYVVLLSRPDILEPVILDFARENLTQLIISALHLGEISYLDHSVEWLNGLLNHRGISTSLAKQFYKLYRLSVEHYLGPDGAIILDWLDKQI